MHPQRPPKHASRGVCEGLLSMKIPGHWRIVPDSLIHPDPEFGESLDLRGYRQLDGFSCGAVSGWMVVKTFHPQASYKAFYECCHPDPEEGMETQPLVRALRAASVGVSVRRSKLTFTEIKKTIGLGFPMIVSIDKPAVEHWVVLYGYEERRNGRTVERSVYLAGNNWFGLERLLGRYRIEDQRVCAYADFRRLQRDETLVCWGKSARPKSRRRD